jgi:hypothetical protein
MDKFEADRRAVYLAYRGRYEPETVKLLIIAESPPVSGLYFYKPDGKVTEPLFAALMEQLGIRCVNKDEGLRSFQLAGWLLVDATYTPVDKGYTESLRNMIMAQDYEHLLADLIRLSPDKSAPIVLIKSNVCRLLRPKLVRDGFRVLNGETIVFFPSSGQQLRFHQQFRSILTSTQIR